MRCATRKSKGLAGRRGAILVYVAIMLVLLTSCAALAVDSGVIATAQAQLRTVADSAALAGARQLASDRRISATIANLTVEVNSASAKAIAAGNANSVLGKRAQLVAGNIVIGYKNVRGPNADAPGAAVNTSGSPTQFNSVQVTATVNVPSLFSTPFRSGGSTLSVTSTATVGLVPIKEFKIGNVNASILPIVMDAAAYTRMTNGTGGDAFSYVYSTASNGVSTATDGVSESVIYPATTDLAGNWGTIKFGVQNNSTSTVGNQISQGVTPAQMQAEYPGASAVTVPHQFSANPGISAGLESSLTSIIGKAVTVPIYDTSGGTGNNAWYHVYAFASVRIVAVRLSGNPKYVVVQPAISVDTSATLNTTVANSWSSGGGVFLHLSR